ncbi:hypothetical protein RFI_10591 [Reticulomyxa filosa]|uniref:Uncharacterized protein n=1 Tax=Reticulomyxa filosa TaxID=46433 RepID=X6NMC7_RETFI|nr:hypothetical protein RFI_10591 [Reticulomyxa filosa]|eukprot:ETO26547.1 hypothetical protein RFI_10591 [Reticulomyxa filosa]
MNFSRTKQTNDVIGFVSVVNRTQSSTYVYCCELDSANNGCYNYPSSSELHWTCLTAFDYSPCYGQCLDCTSASQSGMCNPFVIIVIVILTTLLYPICYCFDTSVCDMTAYAEVQITVNKKCDECNKNYYDNATRGLIVALAFFTLLKEIIKGMLVYTLIGVNNVNELFAGSWIEFIVGKAALKSHLPLLISAARESPLMMWVLFTQRPPRIVMQLVEMENKGELINNFIIVMNIVFQDFWGFIASINLLNNYGNNSWAGVALFGTLLMIIKHILFAYVQRSTARIEQALNNMIDAANSKDELGEKIDEKPVSATD